MCDKKCDVTADKLRYDGNDHFRSGEYVEALVKYNESLCFAAASRQVSLTYANRSAVYYEAKLFKKCLENIELAKSHGYPEDKLDKLNEREEKSRKFLESYQEDPGNDPWNFFKLSHPANDKIPFIVDCIELREDKKFGRHLITKCDLKPGDVIAIEEPFYKFINQDFSYRRCANCLKSNMLSLMPCLSCSSGEKMKLTAV